MKVSVIVPAYDEIKTIGPCLDALLSQTVAPDEIIVVDNNSKDGTADYVSKHYKKVRLLHEKQQGLIPARNHGFNEAKYEIMGRIDADTIVDPNWVEMLHEVFLDPEASAATGPSYAYDAPISRKFLKKGMKLWQHTTNELISGHKMLWGSNMAITKQCWDIIKHTACNKEDILEDLDLGIHVSEAGLKIVFEENLTTGISARRFNTSRKDILPYLKMWPETYRMHGQIKTARAAEALMRATLLIHAPAYLMLRGYDPDSKSFSLKKFMENEKYDKGNP